MVEVRGVYLIRCLASGEVYVGSSRTVRLRIATHRRALCKGAHFNAALQAAWDTYGASAFQFDVLELVPVDVPLRIVEARYIAALRAREPGRGFNIGVPGTIADRHPPSPPEESPDSYPGSSSDNPPSVRAVMEAMRRVNHTLAAAHTPEWVHLGLSSGQLKTLMVLASHPRMSVSAVAETLEVSKPTASMLVDRLVQLGLAQRTEDPDDRRRTWVEPTTAGNELVTRLRQGGTERLAHALELMDPNDLAALQRGMEALAAIAEREHETAPTAGALPAHQR